MLNIVFYRCPVDTFVFPELGRSRDGDSLEARFNAFKIPESNFLVFEATVRTCRDGCQPAYCNNLSGRSEPSFGRKKRSLNETENAIIQNSHEEVVTKIIEKENGKIFLNKIICNLNIFFLLMKRHKKCK